MKETGERIDILGNTYRLMNGRSSFVSVLDMTTRIKRMKLLMCNTSRPNLALLRRFLNTT